MEIRYSKGVTKPCNINSDAEPDFKLKHNKTSKKLPMVLDFKQGNDRCVCPIDNESGYLNIGYGSASLFKQPMCLKSSGFSFEIQNNGKRSRKTNNMDDYLIDTTPELVKKSSEFDIFETKQDSLSSSSSGVISFAWKNGLPYFVFSLEHDLDNIYVANLQKEYPSIDKSIDYLYFFSSINYRREHKHALSLVGKMKVSSSIILNSGMSKLMQTEFVFFGSYEDYSKETRNSFISQTNKVVNKFSKTSIHKHKFDDIIDHMMGDKHDLTPEDFSPNLELAAIVVKNQQSSRSNKQVTKGGWGLKFLEKSQVMHNGNLKRSFEDITKSIDVVIPNSFHTTPINSKFAPSSILDRWKSNGVCDCGGWDIGCPLNVYHENFFSSEKLFEEEHDPVCLYLEGKQNGEPTLTMAKKGEGMYHINFKSSLSDLQCFSVAVAIIHSQRPELHPIF